MGKKLVIAEKPSVAKTIASALGGAKPGDGCMENEQYVFSWCYGHLLDEAQPSAYDPRYEKWNAADLPILPRQWKYALRRDAGKQYKVLKALIDREDIDCIVNACDAGREGELIFRNVFNQARTDKPMKRLWLSSMESDAVQDGMRHLRPGSEYDNLFFAAQCRSRADWAVGINATRLFTCQYGTLLNVGRVVTPTLALLCTRQDAIDNFKPEPYWHVRLDLKGAEAVSERFTAMEEAQKVFDAVRNSHVTVTSVETKKKTENPPALFDLTSLQREANRLFGFTASKTLEILQGLYEKKLMTYPRTDSRYLTDDMEDTARKTLSVLQEKFAYLTSSSGRQIKRLLNSKKVTDHHAIIPTMEVAKTDPASLSADERVILELAAARLAEAAGEPHLYLQTTVLTEGEGHTFTIKGRKVLQEGWKATQKAAHAALKARPEKEDKDDDADDAAGTIPQFTEGERFDRPDGRITEHLTKAPPTYTEASLLSAMEHAGEKEVTEEIERKGLGTPATRAGIIEKLVKSGLVIRKKKALIPSQSGRLLISVLPQVLTSPSMTAEWENRLARVSKGEEASGAFMKDIYRFTSELVEKNSAPVPAEKKAVFASAGKGGRVSIGTCPKCGAEVMRNAKGWACSNRDCSFGMWKSEKFFEWKKVKFTEKMAKELLKSGKTFVKGMYSSQKDKTYDGYVTIDCSGKYIKYALAFDKKGKK